MASAPATACSVTPWSRTSRSSPRTSIAGMVRREQAAEHERDAVRNRTQADSGDDDTAVAPTASPRARRVCPGARDVRSTTTSAATPRQRSNRAGPVLGRRRDLEHH